MSQTKIIEFPEAHLDAAKKDVTEYRANRTGPKSTLFKMDNIDAGESAFFARQLEHIRAGLYEVEYTDLMYDRLMPISRVVPSGAQEYTIRVMDKVGDAAVLDDNTDVVPNVEISTSERNMRFFTIGLGYWYNVQEARAAAFAGVPILATKAMVCRQQVERKVNDIALLGASSTIAPGATATGLLTATDTGIISQSTTLGAGSGDTEFEGKSADEVLKDLHALTAASYTTSKGKFSVNTLLLPLTTRTALASRRVGDGTNGSILQYFMGADPFVKSEDAIIGLWELESSSAAGAGSAWTGKRAMAYRRDPAALELMISQDFEQMPPQVVNFVVKTLCRMRMGGLAIYQPLTIARLDQV